MKRAILNNNAKRVEYNGIKFRSEFEKEVYCYLLDNKLDFKYEAVKYTLIPEYEMTNINLMSPEFDSKGHKKGFGFVNKKVRAWTYTPDFIMYDLENKTAYIIECKGQITPDFTNKWKLFLSTIAKDTNWNYEVFLIQRKGEMKKMIEYILSKYKK